VRINPRLPGGGSEITVKTSPTGVSSAVITGSSEIIPTRKRPASDSPDCNLTAQLYLAQLTPTGTDTITPEPGPLAPGPTPYSWA
jgi:hypothetical protein